MPQVIKRPGINDPEILAMFYKLFAEELQKNCSGLCLGMSLEEIEDNLNEAGMPELDGFDYAKKLDDSGWFGMTASDVDVLDGAHSVLSSAHDIAVRQWVIDNNIKPRLNNGDLCAYKGNPGTVHYSDRSIALGQYLFRDANWIAKNGNNGGRCINFEEIEVLAEEAKD